MHPLLRRSCALALACAAISTVVAQSPAGDWTGAIDVPQTKLEVRVHLEQRDGTWRGDIDIPAQEAQDLPLTDIAVTGNAIVFAIAEVGGKPTFRGELAADGAAIAGKFTQGGQTFPFALQRVGAVADDGAALNRQLDGFAAWLDESRQLLHVPGCALAVVKDGKLATTFASGRRDVAADAPVTADTLFAIGSSTKAFTTFVLATLVDDGKLEWDAPVRRWLPEFALADEVVAAQMTPRDLVTHRSGMPRHDLVWYGATFARADMVARLRWLPLSHGLRTDFQYNNLMFLCAGHLAERLTGTSWEDLVRQRILLPLGMRRTNFRVAELQADADHAEPHSRTAGKAAADKIACRDITSIGPAGSINSSATEMANWVILQLGAGRFGDRKLLQPTTAKDLHRVRMPMGDRPRRDTAIVDVGYALGWMVDVYRGHRRIHHGGNIDGFSAMVTLLPDDGCGFVALTNLDGTQLGELAIRNLCDRLLGLEPKDWRAELLAQVEAAETAERESKAATAKERQPDAPPSQKLGAYVGNYADKGYGPCAITRRDDKLHLDLHGLQAELEHWHFDVFRVAAAPAATALEGLQLQFVSNFDGDIAAVRIQLDPNVPPTEFAREPDAELRDPEFLRRLVGDYELDGQLATVALAGNTLSVSLPGQHYELLPRQNCIFDLATLNGYSVRFVFDNAGNATGVRFRQPDGVHEARRKQP